MPVLIPVLYNSHTSKIPAPMSVFHTAFEQFLGLNEAQRVESLDEAYALRERGRIGPAPALAEDRAEDHPKPAHCPLHKLNLMGPREWDHLSHQVDGTSLQEWPERISTPLTLLLSPQPSPPCLFWF